MKVLVFTSLYPNNIWPHHGVFVKERMTQFTRLEGCRVKVIAPVPYFPPVKITRRWLFSQVSQQEIIDGLEVYHPRYFMIPKVGMVLYGLLMFFSVLPTMKRIYQEFAFDIIDAHYVYPDGFAAVLLGRFFRKPVVVSARGSDINLLRGFPLVRRLLQYALRKADGVIAVSQSLKEGMVHLGIPGEKITVIPNGVDAGKFHPLPKEEARRKLSLPNRRVILSVGGLVPSKGFDLLIRALQILCQEFQERDLYLVVIGEGPFRRTLEKTISSLGLGEYVGLVGEVPHEELYLWYSAADLFCLLSSREGWPNVLLESLACGTPVVATSVGGIPEVICSDRIGLLVKRNEWDIAAGIARALARPWHSDVIREYAREHMWDRVALSVFHLFKSVLEGGEGVSLS